MNIKLTTVQSVYTLLLVDNPGFPFNGVGDWSEPSSNRTCRVTGNKAVSLVTKLVPFTSYNDRMMNQNHNSANTLYYFVYLVKDCLKHQCCIRYENGTGHNFIVKVLYFNYYFHENLT